MLGLKSIQQSSHTVRGRSGQCSRTRMAQFSSQELIHATNPFTLHTAANLSNGTRPIVKQSDSLGEGRHKLIRDAFLAHLGDFVSAKGVLALQ